MSIRRIILHIGRHKSGTSSLQHYFHGNRGALTNEGILYPLAGRIGLGVAHHAFADSCKDESRLAGQFEEFTRVILSEIEPHHHTLIMSSEHFQNLDHFGRVTKFLSNFKGAHVEIVCYFREYAQYMVSSFRQASQNQRRFRPFSGFLKHKYDLDGFLGNWGKLGTLKIKWFARELLIDGDIVADFCAFTDIPLLQNQSHNKNISIGGNILFFKLAANNLDQTLFTYIELAALGAALPRFRRPFYIAAERVDAARVRSKYNAYLEKRLGEVPKKYWDEYFPLPGMKLLDQDVEFIQNKYPHIDLGPYIPMAKVAKEWF